MKVREHRGGFAASMRTAVEIEPTIEAVAAYFSERRGTLIHHSRIEVTDYGHGVDARDGWNTHLVSFVDGTGVLGMTDGPVWPIAQCCTCGKTAPLDPVGKDNPPRALAIIGWWSTRNEAAGITRAYCSPDCLEHQRGDDMRLNEPPIPISDKATWCCTRFYSPTQQFSGIRRGYEKTLIEEIRRLQAEYTGVNEITETVVHVEDNSAVLKMASGWLVTITTKDHALADDRHAPEGSWIKGFDLPPKITE